MLGLVFSEFMDLVEGAFPDHVFDALIDIAEETFPSAGEYTAVGKYDHHELLSLVTHLSKKTDIPVQNLVRAYGRHLFTRFYAKYPGFFDDVPSSFEFLKSIEDHIHFEVRKLYPNAELPRFLYEEPSENQLILHYSSARPFAHLAWGLIEGCADHFGEEIDIAFTDFSSEEETRATFILSR